MLKEKADASFDTSSSSSSSSSDGGNSDDKEEVESRSRSNPRNGDILGRLMGHKTGRRTVGIEEIKEHESAQQL